MRSGPAATTATTHSSLPLQLHILPPSKSCSTPRWLSIVWHIVQILLLGASLRTMLFSSLLDFNVPFRTPQIGKVGWYMSCRKARGLVTSNLVGRIVRLSMYVCIIYGTLISVSWEIPFPLSDLEQVKCRFHVCFLRPKTTRQFN
jgi:hypothetical protein